MHFLPTLFSNQNMTSSLSWLIDRIFCFNNTTRTISEKRKVERESFCCYRKSNYREKDSSWLSLRHSLPFSATSTEKARERERAISFQIRKATQQRCPQPQSLSPKRAFSLVIFFTTCLGRQRKISAFAPRAKRGRDLSTPEVILTLAHNSEWMTGPCDLGIPSLSLPESRSWF